MAKSKGLAVTLSAQVYHEKHPHRLMRNTPTVGPYSSTMPILVFEGKAGGTEMCPGLRVKELSLQFSTHARTQAYRGTSLTRNTRTPKITIGPLRIGLLWGPTGGVGFLMTEVPLYPITPFFSRVVAHFKISLAFSANITRPAL